MRTSSPSLLGWRLPLVIKASKGTCHDSHLSSKFGMLRAYSVEGDELMKLRSVYLYTPLVCISVMCGNCRLGADIHYRLRGDRVLENRRVVPKAGSLDPRHAHSSGRQTLTSELPLGMGAWPVRKLKEAV